MCSKFILVFSIICQILFSVPIIQYQVCVNLFGCVEFSYIEIRSRYPVSTVYYHDPLTRMYDGLDKLIYNVQVIKNMLNDYANNNS